MILARFLTPPHPLPLFPHTQHPRRDVKRALTQFHPLISHRVAEGGSVSTAAGGRLPASTSIFFERLKRWKLESVLTV